MEEFLFTFEQSLEKIQRPMTMELRSETQTLCSWKMKTHANQQLMTRSKKAKTSSSSRNEFQTKCKHCQNFKKKKKQQLTNQETKG